MKFCTCPDCSLTFPARGMTARYECRCDDCRLEADRMAQERYRVGHGDEIRARHNAYNLAYPDRNSRIGKSWRARNPDKVKAYNAVRRKELRAAKRNENTAAFPLRRIGAGT